MCVFCPCIYEYIFALPHTCVCAWKYACMGLEVEGIIFEMNMNLKIWTTAIWCTGDLGIFTYRMKPGGAGPLEQCYGNGLPVDEETLIHLAHVICPGSYSFWGYVTHSEVKFPHWLITPSLLCSYYIRVGLVNFQCDCGPFRVAINSWSHGGAFQCLWVSLRHSPNPHVLDVDDSHSLFVWLP